MKKSFLDFADGKTLLYPYVDVWGSKDFSNLFYRENILRLASLITLQHFEVCRSQSQNVIKWKSGGNLTDDISYLTDVFIVTNFSHNPHTFNSAKLYILNRISEAYRDNFKFGGNLNHFTLCLTDKLTMTNSLYYPPTFKWANF